jgi:hypothetical protein
MTSPTATVCCLPGGGNARRAGGSSAEGSRINLHRVPGTTQRGWLVALAGAMSAAAPAGATPATATERVAPSPALSVGPGAAWQLRNTAQVSNEPPNTRFKIDGG